MDGKDIMQVILMLIGFCSLLFLTYVTTRYIGTRQNKAMKGKQIQVIESISLGADKRIHLIKAGKTFALIATTSKTIEFLTTLEMDEDILTEDEASQGESLFDFREIFDKYISAYKKQKKPEKPQAEHDAEAEMPGRSNFKSNLNRLKLIVQKGNQAKEDGVEGTDEK